MVVSDIDGCASHFPGVWWFRHPSYISRQHKFSCFSEDKRCSDFFHYLQPHVPLPYILTFFIRSITSSVIYRLLHSYLLHILCFLQSYLDERGWALGLCKLKYSPSVQGYVRLCMTAFHSSHLVSTGCSLHGIELSPTIFHGRLCKGGGR